MAGAAWATDELTYVVLFGLAAVVCVASLARALKVEDRETRYGLVGLLVGSGGWAASHAGLFVAPTVDLKIASYTVGLILGFSTVFSWLYFCSAYTGRSYHRQPDIRRAGLGLYLAVVLVKLTNPLHHQYFRVETVTTPFVRVDIQQQTFHWVATGLAYALAVIGLFMLFERFRDAGYDTRALAGLTALTALPVLADIVGFTSDQLLNVIYAPVGVAVFAVGVLFVYEDRFLAVQLTGDVDEAFVFLSEDNRIRDFNDSASTLFPELTANRGEPVSAVDGLENAAAEDEIITITREGTTKHFLVSSSSFALGQTDIGTVLMFSDVTEIESQRRELARHNEQLEEFATGIRHELRNSLQVIKSRVAAAGGALESGDVGRAQESLRAASDRSGRMSRTVSDLATLAQYGQTVGTTSSVSFADIVREAWAQKDTAGMELTVDGDGVVEADPGRLRSLFESAFEFARHNQADTVTVRLRADGFTITDDGVRPADGDLEKLFAYGDAVPNAEAGMALPNVETLARTHGWTVTVDRTYQDGVRIEIGDVDVEETRSD
jgi:signal transduction histidine kinase